MSIFSISDLHLSSFSPKPMDIFGSRWNGHTEKLIKNWTSIVTDKDTVIVPGDISWAMKLEEAFEDLRLINFLPGQKIIGKGNHDFWWSTLTKLNKFTKENGFDTIKFLYSNAYEVEDIIVCGTRGWYVEKHLQNTVEPTDYAKIVARESIRLKMALDDAVRLRADTKKPIIVYFHFPPVFNSFVCREFIALLHEYKIKNCYFGHIHGTYAVPHTFDYDGIHMTMISADFLNFIPHKTVITKK